LREAAGDSLAHRTTDSPLKLSVAEASLGKSTPRITPFMRVKSERRHVKRQTKAASAVIGGLIVPNVRGAHSSSINHLLERRERTGVRFERERV
jgi:hypothetical protein